MMNMHDMATMAETPDHGAMDHSPAAPAMEHGHGGHGMPPPLSVMDPNGKKGAADFTLLGADAAGAPSLAMDGMAPDRPWPPYERLRAAQPTAFAQDKPVREIRLTLDGDMERYVWLLNNRALSEEDRIAVKQGEIVRFILINRTMMHHPMHLHGHFFRVLNGREDERAPLKHTVDVAPMATTVIEFYTDEPGDWLFHCHLLYHMESGMARIVHYEDFAADPALLAGRAKLHQNAWFAWGEAALLNTMTEGGFTLADRHQIFSASWEAGWERVEETEWETLLTWERPLNTFFALFVGLDLLGERDEIEHHRGVAGISALLPLMVESRAWLDVDGGARFSLEKNLPLTPRVSASPT